MSASSTDSDRKGFPADYTVPGCMDWPRMAFLKAIETKAPEVLESLRRDVLPALPAYIAEMDNNDLLIISLRTLSDVQHSISCDNTGSISYERKLFDERRLFCNFTPFFKWGNRWHLLAPSKEHSTSSNKSGWSVPSDEPTDLTEWLLEAVLGTLWTWHTDPKADTKWNYDFILKKPRFNTPSAFQLTITPGYNPVTETKSDFLRRAHQQLDQCLDEYLSSQQLLNQTCRPNSAKTQPGQNILGNWQAFSNFPSYNLCSQRQAYSPQHFEWLVQFQIQQLPWSRIAKEQTHMTHIDTIRHGVWTAAEHVIGPNWTGWLQRRKPGRPRKK